MDLTEYVVYIKGKTTHTPTEHGFNDGCYVD